jgi:hypothetical protein
MKYLKMLGLAVMAAAAFMAFIGANSASATVICTETITPCPAGKKIGPTEDVGVTDHFIHATLEPESSASLLSTEKKLLVTCTESTVTAESEATGSATETAKATVTKLTFGNCSSTVDVLKGGTLEVHWIEGTHHGTVTSKEAEVTVNIAGVSCTYGSQNGTDIGILTGGSMGTMEINAVVNKVAGSFLCPSTAIWQANYTITEPEPIYVLKE